MVMDRDFVALRFGLEDGECGPEGAEEGEKKEKRKAIATAAKSRPKIAAVTKTAIVEKSQTNEAKMRRVTEGTRAKMQMRTCAWRVTSYKVRVASYTLHAAS